MRVDCPKCGSQAAWYEKTHQDVFLRCMCGYCRVIATRLQDILIEHFDAGDTIVLPRRGTKLWMCLAVLYALEPATTHNITEVLNEGPLKGQSVSDVASQLTVLRYKGLVIVTEHRKGVIGGSTWTLTDEARQLFLKAA